MNRMRVGVVFGGQSGEHEVSLVSARAIMAALDPARYEVVPIGITKEGQWITSGDPYRQLTGAVEALAEPGRLPRSSLQDGATSTGPGAVAPAFAVLPSSEERIRLDVVFPVLHGPHGEDGTVQGLLELAGLPFVGAGVLASAVGMDKAMMKRVFQQAGLPSVDYLVCTRRQWERTPDAVRKAIEGRLTYPVFTKPANLGSSVGIRKVHGREELAAALDEAARYDRTIVVEQGIDAREVECSVLGNDDPRVSIPGEVIPGREFYDYEAKYFDHGTRLLVPAPLDAETTSTIQRLAIAAFEAIDCAGMARVDFLIDRNTGTVYCNEINTIPGFTEASAYPKLWEASGLSFSQLVDRLIELALERHEEKHRNR